MSDKTDELAGLVTSIIKGALIGLSALVLMILVTIIVIIVL